MYRLHRAFFYFIVPRFINDIVSLASLGPKSNLLAIWTQMNSAAARRREEFEGRKNSVDGKAELYQDLNKEMNSISR